MFSQNNKPDVIIETTGSSHAIRETLPCLKKGGRVVMVGLFPREVAFDLSRDLVLKEALCVEFMAV
jgi:threonine dehydrogenase-like Zn-dependent dehydrogenase